MILALKNKIEAVLFYHGESMSQKELARLLVVKPSEIKSALAELKTDLNERGIILISKDDEVMLGTHPEAGPIIETMVKEELNKSLSGGALETLAIILYGSPVTRTKIDYLRGVNSSFILRQLQIRGLIERDIDPADSRRFLYRPTFALLGHLGLTETSELPDYEETVKSLSILSQNSDATE